MTDSPRWCNVCQEWGDHHTGRHLHPWVDDGRGLCVECGHARGTPHLIGKTCLHGAYDAKTGRCPDCGEAVVTDRVTSGANPASSSDRYGPE